MAASPALPENAPSIGLGRYVLVARIGEGGMAGVYRAWDKKLRVWRAVKVLLPEFARRRKVRARFESEAHTMARLEHDNLVRIYDVGDAGELPFIVMELVSGGTLQGWTRRHGPMPPRMAAAVTLQLANGVLAAHDAGVVHRDIKPQNVLVAPTGTCKLTDFGIAHVDDDGMTRTGSVLGTLGYMAPEQRNDAKSVDPRADIYSIGATLWHLLTAEAAQDLFLAADSPRMLESVAEPLRPVLRRCFAYDRERRWPDVRALVAALEAIRDQLPEVPADTPDLVQDTADEEVAVEDTDFDEIHSLLDASARGVAPATVDAARLVPASKAPLPYFMPETNRSRRHPIGEAQADGELIPDWIDKDSLSSGQEPAEVAVIGPDLPRTASLEGSRPEPPDAPPSGGPEAPEPARDAPPSTPSPSPEPAGDEETSTAYRLLRAAIVPAGLAFAVMAVAVIVLALQFSDVARELRDAERAVVDSRARLYAVLQDDRVIVDQLAALGADRATLEGGWLAFTETRDEPARSRAALAFLDVMEREAERATIHRGTTVPGDEASQTLRRIHSARQNYASTLAAWEQAAAAPRSQVVILLGGASSPTELARPMN